jgi:hypothetical protein
MLKQVFEGSMSASRCILSTTSTVDGAPMDLSALMTDQDAIIRAVSEKSVTHYRDLMSWFDATNAADDEAFQRRFAYFYRMNRRGLTPEFKLHYFRRLEELRDEPTVPVSDLVWELYEFPTGRGKSLQLSFATKLAHTANPSYPIYDSLVSRVFGFRPAYVKDPRARFATLWTFYSALAPTYERMLAQPETQSLVEAFHRKYRTTPREVSDVKVLDFVLWAAGKCGHTLDLTLRTPEAPDGGA